MIERLGNVVYWAATAVSIIWIGFTTYAETTTNYPFRWELWAVIGPGLAGLIWLSGRALRYVLAGK
jgi:hypothetical protein